MHKLHSHSAHHGRSRNRDVYSSSSEHGRTDEMKHSTGTLHSPLFFFLFFAGLTTINNNYL